MNGQCQVIMRRDVRCTRPAVGWDVRCKRHGGYHSDDRAECAMMRERLVAGTDELVPTCPIHGEWTGED